MPRMHYGVNEALEEIANELIRQSLIGVTSYAAKSDILTPWKEQMRRGREVYVSSGSPDPALRRGMYHRALNRTHPHLNSVDGCPPPSREWVPPDPDESFVHRYLSGTSE